MDLPPFEPKALTTAQVADPYPVYRRYREHDPVHWSAPAHAWYVFGYDDVLAVSSSRDFGRSGSVMPSGYDALRRVVGNWLVFLDPPRHTRLKAMLVKDFTPSAVRDLRPRIERIADDLAVALADRPVVDLIEEFAAPLPIFVICELLGLPAQDRTWLRERSVALQQGSSVRRGDYAVAEQAAEEFTDYFRRAARRPGVDGLLGSLVRAGLPEDEIVGTCVHLITAGHETTTHLIGKAVLALLRHPTPLHEHLPVTGDMVDELVRYDAPVQMVSRRAHRDVPVGGRHIRAGDKAVLVLGSANRDPSHFATPDALRLDRVPGRHCGFGLGIHHCLGATLARLEARIGLTALMRYLPSAGLAEEPVRYTDDLVFHGPVRLALRTGHRP
jgi:cytochrome P450